MSAHKNKKNTVGAPFGEIPVRHDTTVPAERTLILILAMISILSILTLIIGRINDSKSLDQIIYNAKKEAEQTLVSTGRVIYAEDVNNSVGAGPVSAQNENLPENTETNPQPEGTIVKPKENWNIETVKAISIGNGQTIPVPIGFYYVGGDLNTGVIISDEEADQYDGITDKTTWEYTTKLKGNQFVWIPCKEEEYKKCEVWNGSNQPGNIERDKTTYSSELPQIRKYEGFYVGRYEAGLAETIDEFTSTQKSDSSVYNVDGIPQVKAGKVPWEYINLTQAQKNTKNMYNTESVSSGLITGTQWDVMLKTFIGKKMYDGTELTEADLVNSEKWGNLQDNSIEYTGRMARTYTGSFTHAPFGGEETGKTSVYGGDANGCILTTGASKQTEVYHIYDVAGNVWEMTEEVGSSKYDVVLRGGAGCSSATLGSACYTMESGYYNRSVWTNSFRVVLYMK